jgi:hypothetical protein
MSYAHLCAGLNADSVRNLRHDPASWRWFSLADFMTIETEIPSSAKPAEGGIWTLTVKGI